MIDVSFTAGEDEPASWREHLQATRLAMASEGATELAIRHELAAQLAELRAAALRRQHARSVEAHRFLRLPIAPDPTLTDLLPHLATLGLAAARRDDRDALEEAIAILETVPVEAAA